MVKDDAVLFNTEELLPNQRVIRNDCDRTRSRERKIQSSFVDYTEKFLTYYCIDNQIKYRQGLNEIFGPFVLIKSKIDIKFASLYNLAEMFIDKYLTNYFKEDEFYSLQTSLSLITVLVKYHAPEIFRVFETSMITPELFATSWMLTLFANKCRLDIIYHLWDKVILFDNNILMHFLIVAFLIHEKEQYINTEFSQVPSIISQLTISTTEQMDDIIALAFDLYTRTPLSFRLLVDRLEIFEYQSKRQKELCDNYCIDSLIALPLFPSELIQTIFSEEINCYNDKCPCFKPKFQRIKNPNCNNCTENILSNESYLIVDMRIKDIKSHESINSILNNKDSNNSCGYIAGSFFPKRNNLNIEELGTNEEALNAELENMFEQIKSNCKDGIENTHLIFVSSETDYYTEIKIKNRMKRFKQKITEKEILNYKSKSKEKKWDSVKYKMSNASKKIYEYNFMKRLIMYLYTKTVRKISFVYGGFSEVHNLAMKYGLALSSHGSKCELCKRLKKKQKKEEEKEKGVISSIIKFLKDEEEVKKGSKKKKEFYEDINENEIEKEKYTKGILNDNGKTSHIILRVSEEGIDVYKAKRDTEGKEIDKYFHLVNISIFELENVHNEKKYGNNVLIYFTYNKKPEMLFLNLLNEKNVSSFIENVREYVEKEMKKKE